MELKSASDWKPFPKLIEQPEADEKRIAKTLKQVEAYWQQYEAAFRDAEQFNSNPNVPHRGNVYSWRDQPYPDTPEWVTTGLALIAKIKGVGDTDG